MADKTNFSTDERLSSKLYEPSDYQASNQLGQGLAETHEQVSDAYMEGTVDTTIENDQGKEKNLKISAET